MITSFIICTHYDCEQIIKFDAAYFMIQMIIKTARRRVHSGKMKAPQRNSSVLTWKMLIAYLNKLPVICILQSSPRLFLEEKLTGKLELLTLSVRYCKPLSRLSLNRVTGEATCSTCLHAAIEISFFNWRYWTSNKISAPVFFSPLVQVLKPLWRYKLIIGTQLRATNPPRWQMRGLKRNGVTLLFQCESVRD